MKMKYEREQGMTSIYRKLKKECRSFNLRRHLATFILAVAMMAPASVYADWTGSIVSEKPAGQAYEAGWADSNGDISVPSVDQIQFIGHGVARVTVIFADGDEGPDKTVRGAVRLTVGVDLILEEGCDQAFLSCDNRRIIFEPAPSGAKITVELKGAFEIINTASGAGNQRGTLIFYLTND